VYGLFLLVRINFYISELYLNLLYGNDRILAFNGIMVNVNTDILTLQIALLCFGAAVQVCMSVHQASCFLSWETPVKSCSTLSLLASNVWGFFLIVVPVSSWTLILKWHPQGHSGWLGRKQLWGSVHNSALILQIFHELLTVSVGLFSW